MISATDKPENGVENSEQEYIQVTDEMVEAGADKLRSVLGCEDRYSEEDFILVRDIFEVMAGAAHHLEQIAVDRACNQTQI